MLALFEAGCRLVPLSLLSNISPFWSVDCVVDNWCRLCVKPDKPISRIPSPPHLVLGLLPRDIVVSVARRPVGSARAFDDLLHTLGKVGVILPVSIKRGGIHGSSKAVFLEVDGR